MKYDLIVRNGTIVDGSGMTKFRADVGIIRGKIAKIGRINEQGREEIDAEGCIVTPGFIDGHTHMDAQIHWDPLGTCSSWNGVTTVVMGNCGFSLAPSCADGRALVVRNLERAEDISPEAMGAGIKWNWTTFPEYLDAIDRLPKGINYASYIGHSALRTWAMGERAFEHHASEEQLELMQRQLLMALEAGAIGFSTSRSINHETADDRPVASRLASWEEVRRLVGTMGNFGSGVFEISQEEAGRSADPGVRGEYHGRLQKLAIETGVATTFAVLPLPSAEALEDQLDMFDRTSAAGGHMFGQCHSRGVSILASFRTQLPFDRLADWREVRRLPLDEQMQLLRQPDIRKRLVLAAHGGDYGRPVGAAPRIPDWSTMQVYNNPVRPNPSVAEMAKQRGVDPVDLIIDLSIESGFKQFFIQPSSGTNSVDLLKIMRHPRTIMTFSDSGAHVSQIADSSIQSHLLAYWVREREAFTIEEAVRMITFAPARAWGFHDRGLIREGMAADLNTIDLPRLTPELPELAYDLPTGAKRLIQRSSGIRSTIVGGEILLRDGEHTGALPGRLIRSHQSNSSGQALT